MGFFKNIFGGGEAPAKTEETSSVINQGSVNTSPTAQSEPLMASPDLIVAAHDKSISPELQKKLDDANEIAKAAETAAADAHIAAENKKAEDNLGAPIV